MRRSVLLRARFFHVLQEDPQVRGRLDSRHHHGRGHSRVAGEGGLWVLQERYGDPQEGGPSGHLRGVPRDEDEEAVPIEHPKQRLRRHILRGHPADTGHGHLLQGRGRADIRRQLFLYGHRDRVNVEEACVQHLPDRRHDKPDTDLRLHPAGEDLLG